ncbi:hypothetical protein [Granulicella arctica]|uniref:hypothetical protein n=1 Tax=Granulicella arctica TaxID=940613 RepID=UPI0021E0F3E1|nr:hypothetical protein [Granulicella arctica]
MSSIASKRSNRRCNKGFAITSQRVMSAALLAIAALIFDGNAHAAANPGPTARPPRDWIVETAANEILMLQHSGTYLRYRMHVVDQKGDQVRDVIESKDGTVARLILRDGRALTAEEDAAERERLNDVLASPANYAKHVKNDASGKKLAVDLIRLMPDAMIYTYVPGQPPSGRGSGSPEVVLDYTPNPKWSPPSTTAEALTGLQGRMWLDVKTHCMVRMEGQIFKPVNFGWGMLAHIYPGGKLELEQTDAGNGRWIYTHFTQQVTIRALLLKTLNVHTQIDASAFQILPGEMSYQDAIRLLLSTSAPSH